MNAEQAGLLKTRAENFAHHLQTRLRCLGEPEETVWAENNSPESEVYYDIDSSLASPQEELSEPIFILKDNNGFPLQRDESSDSQYFDSVEEQTTLPSTEAENNLVGSQLDWESGCSRIQEFPTFDLEPHYIEKEVIGNYENSECENNNCQKQDEREFNFTANIVDVTTTESDTRHEEENVIDSDSGLPLCTFCDIEQIKSSLVEERAAVEPQEKETATTLDIIHNEPLTETEKTISLSDLLQVLQKEISRESTPTREQTGHSESENNVSCPNIEIIESSPVQSKNKEEVDEEFDIEAKRKNFRRSSSLKSGKTPPGTPGRKKIVRFADVFGLDLADVKTFLDEVPTVPKSAYEDLHGVDFSTSAVESSNNRITVVTSIPDRVLLPLFHQPSGQPNFLDRVRHNNICLESAFVSDSALFAITGLVRVRNVDYHKSVYVRYSIDRWRSFSDLQARYVPNSCDGFSDKFTFVLYAHTLSIDQRLEFAVRFHAAGAQFWDNNGGINYIFECTSRALGDPGIPPSPMETWASFY